MTSAQLADRVIGWLAAGPIDAIRDLLGHARERWPGMEQEDRERIRSALRQVGPFRRTMARGWLSQEVMDEWNAFAAWVEEQP